MSVELTLLLVIPVVGAAVAALWIGATAFQGASLGQTLARAARVGQAPAEDAEKEKETTGEQASGRTVHAVEPKPERRPEALVEPERKRASAA